MTRFEGFFAAPPVVRPGACRILKTRAPRGVSYFEDIFWHPPTHAWGIWYFEGIFAVSGYEAIRVVRYRAMPCRGRSLSRAEGVRSLAAVASVPPLARSLGPWWQLLTTARSLARVCRPPRSLGRSLAFVVCWPPFARPLARSRWSAWAARSFARSGGRPLAHSLARSCLAARSAARSSDTGQLALMRPAI